MSSEAVAALIESMRSGGGSTAESFFIGEGLGAAYDSVSKYDGIKKHVNAALLQAEREGRLVGVVRKGLRVYGLTDMISNESENHVASVNIPQSNSVSRLFISHASADAHLADALADLLRLGTDLPSGRIFCTSLEGMGIPIGNMNYLELLRSQIEHAGLVLPLLTPAFFDSEVCLIEIGAMWGMQQRTFPIIVPPVNFSRVEKLLGKVQGATIDKEKDLSELHDRIVEVFDLTANTGMWNRKRMQFESKLPSLLSTLAGATRVSAIDHESAKIRITEQEENVRALNEELGDVQDRLKRVTQAKTREMLQEATCPKGADIQEFQALVKVAHEDLWAFTTGLREAIYEEFGRGQAFSPDFGGSHYDDAEEACRDGFLEYNEEEGGYQLNIGDPAIEQAVADLEKLFSRGWGEEVETWFKNTHKKTLSVKVRATWAALGLL